MLLVLERLLQFYPTLKEMVVCDVCGEHGKILGLLRQENSKTYYWSIPFGTMLKIL